MNEQNQQQAQEAPTAMGTAVEFSMAWLATQGDIGKMVQRTLVTALQESQNMREVLLRQTQELAKTKKALECYEPPRENSVDLPHRSESTSGGFKTYSPERIKPGEIAPQ